MFGPSIFVLLGFWCSRVFVLLGFLCFRVLVPLVSGVLWAPLRASRYHLIMSFLWCVQMVITVACICSSFVRGLEAI